MVYTVVVFSRQLFYLFLVREQSLAIESSKNAEKLRELIKFDFIVDEGRDGWTLFAINNGGKLRRRRRGIEEMQREEKSRSVRPLLCDPG